MVPVAPKVRPDIKYSCLGVSLTKPDILSGMRTQHPVTAPNERPAYSNIAFTIIFMAIEEATGKNYTQLVDELFAQPLGLTSTRPSPGDDDLAVIPPIDNSWGGNYGLNAPYVSPSPLSPLQCAH